MTKRKPTGKFGLSVGNVLAVAGVLLIVLSSLFFVTKQKTDTAYAATTDTLNFQGRLMSSGGNIVDDGVYNMQFSIYYVSSGGSAQWTEDRLVTNTQGVTIKNGYFSVNLGEYDTFGAIDWGNDLYLGMTVRGTTNCAWGSCSPADAEMTPRLKLTSVPYAMKAGNVGSNNTNSASTNSNGVSITSGNALGATSNSGNIGIDVGTATGTAGTISIGTANTSGITIGRTGVTSTNVGALTVTQAFTANGGATIVGTTTINTTGTSSTQIGNATGTFQLDSNTLDISNAGAITGATGLTLASGNFVQSGAGTFSTGTGAVSLNGSTTMNGGQFVNNGATLNTASAISDVAAGGNIGTAAATVDVKTTFNVNQTTASQTLTLPNPTDTTSGRIVYINNVGSVSFTMYGSVIASGQSNAFIWNGSAWVTSVSLSGSVVSSVGTIDSQTKSADGAVISSNAIYLQTADATNPGLVSTGTQTFAGDKTFSGNIVLAALKSLSVAGGNTASRPGSPTEGMVYFDTDTDKLIVYSNGKWQADRTTATKIVAASNSSQAVKDSADYVADGTADETEINAALTAAAGGTVYLAEGTYVADTTILIPNNTTLAGSGRNSLIEFGNVDSTDNLIENSDTTTGTGVIVKDLRLDGRKDLNTVGQQFGIFMNGLGSGSGASARKGGLITNLWIDNFNYNGIRIQSSSNIKITQNNIFNNDGSGIYLSNSTMNTDVSNNNIQANALYGVRITGDNNTVIGNTIRESISAGVFLDSGADYNIVANNNIIDSGDVATNKGVLITSADNNTITSNIIKDSSCTTTCNAISITDSASDNTYLADNTISGPSAAYPATISNSGTGTIFANQSNTADKILQSSSTRIFANSTNVISGSIDPAASTSVTGVGTYFLSELQVGDKIIVTGETRTVVAIASNTSLTVDLAFSNNANDTTVDRLPAALVVTDSSGVAKVTVDDTGALYAWSGQITIGTASQAGGLEISDGSSNSATLVTAALSANRTISLPDEDGTICLQSSANCGFVTTSTGFIQNGNSFGANAVLGTNDAYSLGFETGGNTQLTIANGGAVTFQNSTDSTSGLKVMDADGGTSILNVDTTNERVGIGEDTPDYVLDVVGSVVDEDLGSLARFEATSTTTSNQAVNAVGGLITANPSSASTAVYTGVLGRADSSSSNLASAYLLGLLGLSQFDGTASLSRAVGSSTQVINSSTGTIDNAIGYLTNDALNLGGGTITNNYGILINPLTAGTNDYGIAVGAADTQTLWLSNNADNTTAAAGIAFGSSRDTNLYRSAANTLKTDDSLTVAANLDVDGQAAFGSGAVLGGCAWLTCGASEVVGVSTAINSTNTNDLVFGNLTETKISNSSTRSIAGVGSAGIILLENSALNDSTINTGLFGGAYYSGTANVDVIQGLYVEATNFGGSGTLTNAYGVYVGGISGATNNYGIYVSNGKEYGASIATASTQTLWVGSNANDTTSNAGIAFGSSRDTNLYRSAADMLMTDDSLTVGTDLTVTGATTLNGNLTVGNATTDRVTLTAQLAGASPIVLQGATDDGFTTTIAVTDPTANNVITLPNATGTVALVTSGSSTSGVSAFTQGGNTWAGTGTLGLVDSNTLNIITANTTRLSISGTGSTTITGGTSGTALTVNNSTSTGNIFDFQENGTNVLSLLDSTNGGYLQFNSGADRVISVAQQTSSNTAGNNLTVVSGQGNGSGAGGMMILGAGSGGPTGTGGATYVVGGTGGSTSGNGGSLNLQGGQTTSGAGGGIGILAANSTGANTGGAISIQSGTGGATGTGGALALQAGSGGASGASGGAVSITGGTGQGVATISFSVPGGVNGTTEVITTSSSHGLVTGDTVMYDDNGGGYIIGLAENKVYYVRNLSSTTLSLHPTSADASANTNAVNVNTQAGGSQTDYLFKTNLGNGGSTTIAGGDANSYAAGGNIVFQTASSNASLTTVAYFNSVNGGLTLQNTIDGDEAFRILNSAGTAILTTNTSQVWNPTRDLPNETSESGAFIANGHAYVIGGMDNNDDLDTPLSTVYYADVNSDGSLGSWSTTTALPAARAGHSVTYANGYVYVAGGANSTRPNALNEWRLQAGNNTVYYARVNADGTLGAWSTANSLPAARVNHSAETYNGYLYIVGGAAAGNGAPSRDVYYARINSDGSLGSWTTQSNWLNEGRMLHDSVVLNNQLYVVWGTDDYLTVPTTADGDNTLSHGVFNEDGSLGTVDQDSTSGVEPNILINAEVVNGKIYVYGGLYLSGATQLPQNLKVIFNLTSDGQFSSLSSTAPTPASTNLYARSSAQYNGTIYRFGGTGSLTQDLADVVALPGGNCVGSEIEVCGNNSVATVEYMATPKVNITGSLDLTSGGVAGNLRAGNTTIAGTLEVTSGAEFKDSVLIQNGLLVRGTSLLEGAVGFGTQTTAQSCASNCTITQSNVDNYSALTINATASSVVVSMPDPTVTTAGKVVYVTAVDGSNDFTLRLNSGGTQIDISMRENTTATLIWNGDDWTAAGASSSTDLQAAYNNTLTSAGGAELVLNAAGGAADGLTIRNNATTPITGALLEVQTSIGSNLLSVNNNATEYAQNGGAETSTFTMWTAAPAGGAITRYTTAGNYIATGQASTSVVTGAVAAHGVRNTLSTSLTANLKYSVSFAVRGTTNFNTLDVVYSRDGTNTSTTSCATGQTVTTGKWSRIICTFTAPSSGITSSNAIFIRQSDATARTFYADNLSVNVSADVNHAADGSVDSALGTNWTNFGTLDSLTRDTTTIYDTSGSVAVNTPNAVDRGVRNNLSITPSTSTQYLVTFYAKSTNTFNDIRVRYTRDGGTNFTSCTDYSTQSVSTSTWTEVTCLFTTDSTTATDPDLIIDQPSASDRTFYVDALSITLNQNTANNVQVGGANKGGPTTLFTLDRGASAPVGDNNDAYLGSMYYDTVTGRIQCYEADGWGACGAAPDNYVNLNPEYAGAVLNGTGVGTMTADFCSNQAGVLQVNYSAATDPCYTSGDVKNYYRWTSPQATQQTYSIYVTYQLPATFRGFSSDDTVQLAGRVDNTTNAAVTYQMYAKTTAGALAQCGTGETDVITGGGGSANTWYSYGINGNESTGCSLNSSYANGFIIFKINMKANSNANAYVSTLSFTTTGQ